MFTLPYRTALAIVLVASAACAAAQPRAADLQARPMVRPMYRQADSGWLEREVYRSPADAGVAVQFVDVVVGPGRTALVRQMPAGALLDVQAGTALLTVGQMRKRGAPGAVVPIDQGQGLSIDNRDGDRPFLARLIRIASPRSP